jgi:protein TonB
MRLDTTRSAFSRFLLVSVAAHIALLWLAGGHRMAPPRYLGWPELNIQTTETQGGTPGTPVTERPSRQFAAADMAKGGSVVVTDAETGINTDNTAQNSGQTTRSDQAATAQAAPQNFLLGEVQTQLSRYLRYPPLAREKGWEGTVLVGFRMDSDGSLEHIHVARSSGYDVLDQSAVHSLSRVERLEQLTPRLQGQTLAMQLPVVYRLIEN